MNVSNVSKEKSDKQTIILDNDNVSVSVCKERKVFKFKVKVKKVSKYDTVRL